jgi:glutaredoxin-like protein NrdH
VQNRLPIVIYSKSNCVQCTQTKKLLDKLGYQWIEHKVDEDPLSLAYVQNMGYAAAPVVVLPFDWPSDGPRHWSGFIPDNLKAIR